MAPSRSLPRKHNHVFDDPPTYEELVSQRKLGSTVLAIEPSLVGGGVSATKPETLGVFEYVALKVKLPDNLHATDMHPPLENGKIPESHYLMRRSKDGYVSATGLFKAAFPWAKHKEEADERDYIMKRHETSEHENAGNCWVSEDAALELAKDYNMVPYVEALLDSAEVASEGKKSIAVPPPFHFKANGSTSLPPPTPAKRGRPRTASPSKAPKTPKDSQASPRKKREPKSTVKEIKDGAKSAVKSAGDALNSAFDRGTSVADSDATELDDKPHTAWSPLDDKVVVSVDTIVESKGDVETTTTHVEVKMPADSPDLPLPKTTEEMINTAKEMVEEARRLEGEGSSPKQKRKVEELELEDEGRDVEIDQATGQDSPPAKKARLLELEIRKNKVRTRAMVGIAATLAIGALIPYALGA